MPPPKTSDSSPKTTSTALSSTTSRASWTSTALAELTSNAIAQEENLLQSLISSLGLVRGPEGASYAQIKELERSQSLLYLGGIKGTVWFAPASVTRHQIGRAIEQLVGQPGDEGRIRRALYDLWLLTKHERMATEDRDAMLLTYARRLADYPEPTVILALRRIAESYKFFPSWSEISEEIHQINGWRGSAIIALKALARNLV